MGKFIITEEEKKSIRGLYGLNEQTLTLPILISDTFETKNGDSDAAHNLKGLEKKIDKAIEQIYNQGINPKMYDVKLKVVRNGNTYTTTSSLTIDKSDDGKAWTGFASRGSIGYDYVNRAEGQIDGTGNKDGRSLEEKLKSGADAVEIIPISNSPITISNVELKQYFVQFTKSLKPSHTSSKSNKQPTPQPKTQPSQPKTQQNALETIEGTTLEEFRNNVKSKTGGISIDVNTVVFSYTNNVFKVSYSTGETKIAGMTIKWSNISRRDLDTVIKDKTKIDYPDLIQQEKWKGEWKGDSYYYYEFLILIK
jgi:hypothetical protein